MKRKDSNVVKLDNNNEKEDVNVALLKRKTTVAQHHVPLYRQHPFWAFVVLAVVGIALSTGNPWLVRLFQSITYNSTDSNPTKTSSTPLSNNKESTASMTTGSSSTKSDSSLSSLSASPLDFAIRYRGPKLNDTAKEALTQQWGKWSVWKDKKAPRPALPCSSFDHCDVPQTKFPRNAWQTDAEFLEPFLHQAQELITRAQEAILAEYGQSKFDMPGKSFAERSANFQLDVIHLGDDGSKSHPPDAKMSNIDNGGWTTPRSFQGLVRRLLHAIVTQDTFTYALGGHSVAAGHG